VIIVDGVEVVVLIVPAERTELHPNIQPWNVNTVYWGLWERGGSGE
jgi:hypothetical protein